MKIFKKVFCYFFIAIFAATCVSCKSDKKTDDSSQEEVIEYTDYSLVSGGASDYKIVLAEDALYSERFARDEIVDFFFQATGITLKSISESEVTYSENAKLIILGDTDFSRYAGVNVKDIPAQGFTLKTVDSNVFILGEDYGVLYGAYEFLHKTLNYAIYAADEIALDKNVKDLRLQKFDFSDNPDILYREPNYGPVSDVVVGNRFRLNNGIWISQKGNFVHNTFSEYFPTSIYNKEGLETYQPKFYSKKGTQLCYNARGDAEAYAKMQDVAFNRIVELIDYYYKQGDFRESVSFSQEDNNDWCECDACLESLEKYGANSASVIRFLNPIAKRVQEWLDKNWTGHTVNIAFFAYIKSEEAPVQSINGKYLPVRKLNSDEKANVVEGKLNGQMVYKVGEESYVEEESLYLEDNVTLFYAPIYADYMYDFSHSKNAAYMETLRKWMAVADKLYLWFYSTNYRDYMIWYDSFNSMQPLYRLVKDCNSIYFFDQGRYNTNALTAFDTLKIYLNSKLAWNVDADYTKMIDDFFKNYFRDAAKPMKRYFDGFRSWSQYVKDTMSISGQCNTPISYANFWPKQVLIGWENCINEAYAAIEPLKGKDRNLYDKVYERIEKESIAIRYHLYELHENSYEEETLRALRQQFKADATRLGFTQYNETGSIAENVYAKWGV